MIKGAGKRRSNFPLFLVGQLRRTDKSHGSVESSAPWLMFPEIAMNSVGKFTFNMN